MPEDPEAVKAGAVAELRTALINGLGVAQALRACWYRNPIFSATLFTEAVRHYFGMAPDIPAITGLISRIRLDKAGFPQREAEAVVRAALGETAFFDYVHPAKFNYPELGIAVLYRLFLEWQPSRAEIERLFRRVEDLLVAVHELRPELAQAENDWFAVKMHESPFVIPTGVGPAQTPRGR